MKRANIKILSGLLLAGLAMASCTKQLDKYPFSDIELSQSFRNVKDAKTWNNGIYSSLRGRVYGIYTFTTDVQADQLNASLSFGNRNGAPHRWEGFLADDYSIRDIWSGYYSGIKDLNIQLAGFENITPATPAETDSLNRYKGDAHLARAYYYHRLIVRWGKSYEPGTAASDPGVPLVTAYDAYAKPARASVKEVYDQILADITAAKTLLGNITGRQGATRFTADAALALEARVKLDMQDWPGAKAAADALITSNRYPLINTATDMLAMWKNDLGREVIFQSKVSKPAELANANSIYLGLIAQTGRFQPDFIPSQWVVDMYADNDIRKNVYFERKNLTILGAAFSDIWLVNKYQGNPDLFTAATTNYQHAPKVFRIAEMYLISAEAGARAGAGTAAAALITLNELRVARGLLPEVGLTGTALFNAVKDERFRELAFEGFRLDDLKRWKEGFTRRSPQNENTITRGEFYQGLSITANAEKFVWGLPTNDYTINTNLRPQNPGW